MITDCLLAFGSFFALLVYATIGIAVGQIWQRRIKRRCAGYHICCGAARCNSTYMVAVPWPLTLALLGTYAVTRKGPMPMVLSLSRCLVRIASQFAIPRVERDAERERLIAEREQRIAAKERELGIGDRS